MVGSHHNHVENVLTMFWAVSYQCIIKPLTIIAKHSILDVAAALIWFNVMLDLNIDTKTYLIQTC